MAAQSIQADLSQEPVYAPRRFTMGEPWRIGGGVFKTHFIGVDTTLPPFLDKGFIVDAAYRHCQMLSVEMQTVGDHLGLGFVVLHEGEGGANIWLIFNWWITGGIRCQILSRAFGERPDDFQRVSQPYSACVWEGVCIEHERQAWVRCCLNGQPKADAYIEARMADGLR
jgi:hypothetical protein